MPFNIAQQDIVEVSKIIGVQFAMSIAALLLNDRFKISPVSAEAAVMIGLLSIPMGLATATLFTAFTGQSIFNVDVSQQHSPTSHGIVPAHRIPQ